MNNFSNLGTFGTFSTPILYPNVPNYPSNRYVTLVYPTELALSLDSVKEWLKIPLTQTDDDILLTTLIKATSDFFERYTNRILINTTFRHFNDFFAQSFEISRGDFQSLSSFTYFSNGSYVEVPASLYEVLNERFYWRIIFNSFDFLKLQLDVTDLPYQNIRIDFICGFGLTSDDVPEDIKLALKNHIAFLYESRGDCDSVTCGKSEFLPVVTRSIYNQYRHLSITGSKYRGI